MTKQTYRLDVSKIKTLKDARNVFDLMNLVGSYDPEDPEDDYYHLREYFTILQEPQGLTFSTPRRSIEEIQQEFDEKIDKLIEDTKNRFKQHQIISERIYNTKFARIIDNFEQAKKWGEKNKPKTLYGILQEWWNDILAKNSDLDFDISIDYLVDLIDTKFIPPSSKTNSYEWEKCLKMMRDNLRDT